MRKAPASGLPCSAAREFTPQVFLNGRRIRDAAPQQEIPDGRHGEHGPSRDIRAVSHRTAKTWSTTH
jgi:hypothetical protein